MNETRLGVVQVDAEYLRELEEFRRSKQMSFESPKLTHKDIVRIDTYKESFVRYLELTRLSIAQERALNVGKERELMGWILALDRMIQDISNIDKRRAEYEAKKEEEKKTDKKS